MNAIERVEALGRKDERVMKRVKLLVEKIDKDPKMEADKLKEDLNEILKEKVTLQ